MKFVAVALSFLLLSSSFINASLHEHTLNDAGKTDGWIKNARIMTPYAYNTTWKEGVAEAVADGANVILDWANFSDSYYGRILEFNNSLEKFRERAEYVHSRYPGIKYMVYFAPFEMQTYDSDMNMDGRDDDGKNSTYTDHPEWLQVGIDGRKAVFYGSMPDMPFWVSEHDEDVWLSPSNEEYRNIIMNEATAIAEAGADAVWFDVPHLLFDYGNGWQSQWCTVDDASRMAFYNDTGLILPSPPLKPSWDNETWLKFVEWRYRQVIDFVKQFNEALKAGNENCRLAVETSVNGLFITQYGCDIEKLPEVYASVLKCRAVLEDVEGIYGVMRTPSFRFIVGKNAETVHVENDIKYKFDVSKIMFSSGNIDERIRMGKIVRKDEVAIDMFAGIGYFSIPMAVNGARVYAIELNPVAYEYLNENAKLNGVEDRIKPVSL